MGGRSPNPGSPRGGHRQSSPGAAAHLLSHASPGGPARTRQGPAACPAGLLGLGSRPAAQLTQDQGAKEAGGWQVPGGGPAWCPLVTPSACPASSGLSPLRRGSDPQPFSRPGALTLRPGWGRLDFRAACRAKSLLSKSQCQQRDEGPFTQRRRANRFKHFRDTQRTPKPGD